MPNGTLTLNIPPGTGHTFLPSDLELEAVSPDSDKMNRSRGSGSDASGDDPLQMDRADSSTTVAISAVASAATAMSAVDNTDMAASLNRSANGVGDDFESPAFEPLEGRTSSALSNRLDDADDDGDNSKLSAISGLTSRDSVESNRSGETQALAEKIPNESFSSAFDEDEENAANETQLDYIEMHVQATRLPPSDADAKVDNRRQCMAAVMSANGGMDMDELTADEQYREKEADQLMPAHALNDHSSELSQVSSNSRLSIATDRESPGGGPPDEHGDEAQMPRFNDNSSNSHNANAATAPDENEHQNPELSLATGAAVLDTAVKMPAPTDLASKSARPRQTSFVDIKQDEIMFEGTRRHSISVDIKAESAAAQPHAPDDAPLPMGLPPPLPLLPPPPPASDTLQPPTMPLEPPTIVPSQMLSMLTAANGSAAANGGDDKQSAMSILSCSSSASSISSSNLIIAETVQDLTLNDDGETNDTNATAMDTDKPTDKSDTIEQPVSAEGSFKAPSPITVDSVADVKHVAPIEIFRASEPAKTNDDFKFEAPAVDSGDSRETSRDASIHKSSRHRDSHSRSHHSSSSSRSSSSQRDKNNASSSTGDKEKHKDSRHRSSSSSSSRHDTHNHSGSSRSKDKRDHSKEPRESKESKDTGDKSKDHKESSHRSSSHSSKSVGRSSSSSSHRSSSHRHASSSKDKERSRHGDSKSSSSSSSSKSSTLHHAKSSNIADHKESPRASKSQSPRKVDDDAADACNQRGIERRRSNDQDSNDGQPSAGAGAGADDMPTVFSSTTAAAASKENSQQAPDGSSVVGNSALAANTFVELGLRSPPPLPVLVDQILTGAQPSDIDLERLIALCASASGDAAEDPALSSIQQTIASTSGAASVKRPMLASNIHEARKLSKVRKQMDRDEQKRLERAVVLAKQYLSRNANTLGDEGQGVELEFACVTQSPNAAPSISSPISPIKQSDARMKEYIGGADDADFIGFTANNVPVQQLFSAEDVRADSANVTRGGEGDFHGFDADDCQPSDYTSDFVQFTSEHAKMNALLQQPDEDTVVTLRRLVANDVWLYTDSDTAAPKSRAAGIASAGGSRLTRNISRPKSQSESCAAAIGLRRASKRHSPGADGPVDLPVAHGFRSRRIKIDAHIQMVGDKTTGNDEMDDTTAMTDDDVRSIDSSSTAGGVSTRSTSGSAAVAQMSDSADCESMDSQLSVARSSALTHVSPTPSDQSTGSKENNFVPKIKKAVSRSLAHNSVMQSSPGLMSPSSASSVATVPVSPSTSRKCKQMAQSGQPSIVLTFCILSIFPSRSCWRGPSGRDGRRQR